MQHKEHGSGFWWPLVSLAGVLGLLLVITLQPFARQRAGGPWSVGALTVAALLLVYLHPVVQDWLKRMGRARARRRYYRDKMLREQEYREQEYLNSRTIAANAGSGESQDKRAAGQ